MKYWGSPSYKILYTDTGKLITVLYVLGQIRGPIILVLYINIWSLLLKYSLVIIFL